MKLFLILSFVVIAVQCASLVSPGLEANGNMADDMSAGGILYDMVDFIEHQVDIYLSDDDREYLYFNDIYYLNIRCMELLIERGADIHANKNFYRRNLLHFSSICGYFEIAQLLLENGAIIEAIDRFRYTALDYSVLNGNFEITNLLLDYGANIEAADWSGCTALSRCRDINMKELLLNRGANANIMKPYAYINEIINKRLSIVSCKTKATLVTINFSHIGI